MSASLPMYDMVEIRPSLDTFWRGLAASFRRQGIGGLPRRLSHDKPVNLLWSDHRLFFSQCCGYDIVHQYRNRLQVLVTPWFNAPGCVDGDYASLVVVPEDSPYTNVLDMLGTVAVVNGPESQSGMNALLSLVSPYSINGKFFSEVKISGSHSRSLELIAGGQGDVAAIDCIVYELLNRYRPAALQGIRPLGLTFPAPAPPYVTNAATSPDMVQRMQYALLEALHDPQLKDCRETLLLGNLQLSSASFYQRISNEFAHNLHAV